MDHDEGTDRLIALYAGLKKQFGLYLFPLLIALGAIMTASGVSLAKDAPADTASAWGGAIEALIAAFLAYRTIIGKGWIAGPLLLLMALVEAYFKLAVGRGLNAGWLVFHAAVIWSIGAAAYECWQIRQLHRDGYQLPALY